MNAAIRAVTRAAIANKLKVVDYLLIQQLSSTLFVCIVIIIQEI